MTVVKIGGVLVCMSLVYVIMISVIHSVTKTTPTIIRRDRVLDLLNRYFDSIYGDYSKIINEFKEFNQPAATFVAHGIPSEDPYPDIDSSARFGQFDFAKCQMHNCFDYTRCKSDGPIKVAIVPTQSPQGEFVPKKSSESYKIHQSIMQIIRNSKHFEPDMTKACLLVIEENTIDLDPLSQGFQSNIAFSIKPENRYGLNHLVFNLYSGTWPNYRENDYAGLQFGAAILAKASSSSNHHRQGFDISLPLFSHLHPPYESSKESLPPNLGSSLALVQNQSYFLTFKGKRYVIGSGSETRNNLHHLENNRDVIMLVTCRHGKKWQQAKDERCNIDEEKYSSHDFADLMKHSTFCMTPRGRRLGSFRYLESLSFGCIPVVLSDGFVKPFDEIIDWSKSVIQFPEDLLLLVPDILRDMSNETIAEMRRHCTETYQEYFSTIERIILTTIEIIEYRIQRAMNDNQLTNSNRMQQPL